MVARTKETTPSSQRDLDRKRALVLELRRDAEKQQLLEDVEELALDVTADPRQLGLYLAELEAAGLLSPADKAAIFQRLAETMGQSFAETAFGMSRRTLASTDFLAEDITHDSYVNVLGDRAIFSDEAEYERAREAAEALTALGEALGLQLDLARPELRRLPDLDHIADPDVERAGKTREVLDTLAPQLGVNAERVDIRVDEGARAETSDVGNYGLMAEGTVFLDPELYDPETTFGRHLLAHELVHIAQLENRLRGANETPDLFAAEAEADELSATFAETGTIKAPLASLQAYDKAACGPAMGGGPPPERRPTTTTEHIPGTETTNERVQEVTLSGAIYFQIDKDQLTQTMNAAETEATMKSVSEKILRYPEITKVDVWGHASTTAVSAHNEALSMRRAANSLKGLVDRGVATGRLTPHHSGEAEHRAALGITDDKTQKEDVAYRRVDFSIAEVNGQPHKGPFKKVSKEVIKTPGKTVVKTYDPDGKLVKTEEVIDGETPPGKLENEPAEETPVAKAEAAQAKEAAAGPTGGGGCGTGSSSKETTAPEQPEKTPAKGTTEEKKAKTRPRRTPGRMTPTRGRKTKIPRRFALGAIRTVAQPKAQSGGLTSTQIDDRTRSQGAGERLPDGVRSRFEQSFGQSFEDVRVHRGSSQAVGIGATAFARGTELHFAPGRFDTQTASGLAVIGHELTHIVQQRAGRVTVPQGMGTHVNVERHLEAEADLLGTRASRGERVSVQGSSAGLYRRAASGAADTIQYEGGKGEGEAPAKVDAAAPAVTAEAAATAPPGAPNPNAIRDTDQPYTTVRGDTLYGLAGRFYNKPNLWPAIYQSNRVALGTNPNMIGVGVAITVPSLENIIQTNPNTNQVLWAFEAYWNVTSSRVDGARRWDVGVIRHIHQQMKALPDQDTRNGVWKGLQLTNRKDLRDRAAWDGSNFIVGQNADVGFTQEMGHQTTLTASAAKGDTTLEVQEPNRFVANDTIAVDRANAALKDTAKVTSIAGTTYTLDTPLTHDHDAFAKVTPDDATAARDVNWLSATVRHEIAHAVETHLGGVTGFTQGLGGWWTGTGVAKAGDFDTWAAAMNDPWGASNGVVLTQDEKNQIREAIVRAVKNRTSDLENSVPNGHPLQREFYNGVGVIEAANRCLQYGDNFFNHADDFYASNDKRFTVSHWYKTFMYHNESVVTNRVSNYSLYAPAEFFAETYSVYYEEAGQPGVSESDYGRLIRESSYRDWMKTNIHERGKAPAAKGAGGGAAVPSGAAVGKRSGNPGR